jgi:hypothetical protein
MVDVSKLTPAAKMAGDNDADTKLMRESLTAAREFLRGFPWCKGIRHEHYGAGIPGKLAVFYFEIDADKSASPELWVIVGDLPAVYLKADSAPTPGDALETYCELMTLWVNTVRTGGDLSKVYPVPVEPNEESAQMLETRVTLIRQVIPALS